MKVMVKVSALVYPTELPEKVKKAINNLFPMELHLQDFGIPALCGEGDLENVIHIPPNRLGLDRCYDGSEAGSKAIYNFLKKYQPKLSLHGHIHESPEVTGRWYAQLGRTICIQPGQLNEFTYVTIDLSTMKFERIKS
ncbi:MAG: hypothetical protein KKD69_01600 [Euryarchaeota archaeon]|nr:hypothetical protein [Euryarchaeota archaeon]MCG2727831.1 hypothetical protein [Candidatus Methanoperedenaceae archaeon]